MKCWSVQRQLEGALPVEKEPATVWIELSWAPEALTVRCSSLNRLLPWAVEQTAETPL
jgi:hypothetical protein